MSIDTSGMTISAGFCLICDTPLSRAKEHQTGRCAACLRQQPVEEKLTGIEALLTEIADQLAAATNRVVRRKP